LLPDALPALEVTPIYPGTTARSNVFCGVPTMDLAPEFTSDLPLELL